MIAAFRWIPAGRVFLARLLGRRDPSVKIHANGLSRLENWPHPPEEIALENARALVDAAQAKERHSLLYCYEGPHLGECFWLRSPETRVGIHSQSDLVLTPAEGAATADYTFRVEASRLQLEAPAPAAFELNGQTVHSASLVDYDELTLMGNRLLVLTIQGGTP